MATKTSPFMRKKLALAVSAVLIGGSLAGCITDDDNNSKSGAYSISMAGGSSSASGSGGDGGELMLASIGGSDGVTISRKGQADARFEPVSEADVDGVMSGLGSNPLVVETDTTIEGVQVVGNVGFTAYSDYLVGGVLFSDTNGTDDGEVVTDGRLYTDSMMTELREADGYGSLAAAGTPYYGDGGEFMMNGVKVADGDDSVTDAYATGLSVAEGATLTIDNANSYYYYSGVAFDGDVINEGSITWGSRNNPGIIMSDGVIANAGVIDHSGVNPGESGGLIGLYAYAIANSGTITAAGAEGGDGGEVGLYSYIGVVNRGPIDVSGGDAPADVTLAGNGLVMTGYAGDGGEIGIDGHHIENTADLDLSGGDGNYPGAGGDLMFDARDVVHNSGNINATAGAGANLPYYGGWVDMYAETGSVINAGNIDASGGDGGESAVVNMSSKYGSVISNGDINVSGGSIEGAGYGGDGGEISFVVESPNGNGSVEVSGNLNVSGGDGSMAAGDGGRIGLFKGIDGNEGGVALLGYTDINGDGGDGRYLGSGGMVMASSANGEAIRFGLDASSFGPDMPGPVVNSADISLRGGDAHADIDSSDYAGYGSGGMVVMQTDMYSGGMQPPRVAVAADNSATVTNNGDIDVSGGTVINGYSSYAAEGGMVQLRGAAGVSNSGKLTANGGDDIGDSETASYGGRGGQVGVFTGMDGDYTAKNSGTIQVNGGNGNYFGGHGGVAGVGGWGAVNNSGNIYADGGNASMEIAVSYGGDGGEIDVVYGLETGTLKNTGTLSAKAGTGKTPGTEGVTYEGISNED